MENKDDILKKLNSSDPGLQHEAIAEIKNTGDISIAPALLDTLVSAEDHHFISELTGLLADIKDNQFKTLLAERIRETSSAPQKALLLRICWESALDFSEYTDLFIQILIRDEFIAALEASTILEELSYPDTEKREKMITLLKNTPASEEKQFLIDNILDTIGQQTEE